MGRLDGGLGGKISFLFFLFFFVNRLNCTVFYHQHY